MIRLSFDFLSQPVAIDSQTVTVFCLENKFLFRKVVNAFISGITEENNIIFSDDYEPVDFKKHITVLYDYFHKDFSSAFLKKLYEDISLYCNDELYSDVTAFRSASENLLLKIVSDYDFDFDYSDDFSLISFFKMRELKPFVSDEPSLDSLLQYVFLLNKYSKIKCFLFINLHLYFDSSELKEFYKELFYNNIKIVDIENSQSFSKNTYEKLIIIDRDFCEIVD